jgi:epoxyqueuosine reductase
VNPEDENRKNLKKLAHDIGLNLFGVADVTEAREEFSLDRAVRRQFDFGISLGKRLIRSVLEEIKDSPTALYLHHYRQLNYFLDRTAFQVSSFIQEAGYRALPIPASQIIDWDNQLAHVSHKRVAFLAGLGWLGRNNLVVTPEFGSQVRLVTVLTDMPLAPDKPVELDCGTCTQCLSFCPAQAIKMDKKDFDHRRCFEKLKEFRRTGMVTQHICGICVKACRGNTD